MDSAVVDGCAKSGLAEVLVADAGLLFDGKAHKECSSQTVPWDGG
jgi:hypothetical protein